MNALTAMTLPSSASAPASAMRDSQAPAQADAARDDDFESTLNQAARPGTPERRATEAAEQAGAERSGDPQAEADADTPPAAPDSWAAQLAYLQPQAAGRSGPSDATDAAPEIEVLNSLGKALTQHAEPGPATQADDAEPRFALPVLADARGAAIGKQAQARVASATPEAALSSTVQPAEALPATDAASAVRPADPAAPTAATVAVTPAAGRAADLLPQVPGAATTLQPQVLQQRMDEALRWMVGQGVQAAQVRIAPEALGPITIHLQMSGEQASVAFISAVDTTRQALEANLSALKESLSQQGFNLDQTFVGNQQQHAAQQSQQDAQAGQRTGGAGTDGGAASATAVATPLPASAPRQGLVDVFA